MKFTISILFLLCLTIPAHAGHLHPEKYYQQKWCDEQGGQTEVVLPDRTRIDCLTETHAIEVDFANKWAESIGQSLHYARMTGKQPGVLMIIESESEMKHLNRIQPLADQAGIDLWTTNP